MGLAEAQKRENMTELYLYAPTYRTVAAPCSSPSCCSRANSALAFPEIFTLLLSVFFAIFVLCCLVAGKLQEVIGQGFFFFLCKIERRNL